MTLGETDNIKCGVCHARCKSLPVIKWARNSAGDRNGQAKATQEGRCRLKEEVPS